MRWVLAREVPRLAAATYSTARTAPNANGGEKLACLDKAIYPTPERKSDFKRIACYALLGTAAAFITVPGMARAQGDFFKLNNPGDPAFNQLLGISNNEIIVGYFGDGTAIFNNGYVLVPNTHYSVENFTGTAPAGHTVTQTQAIGINNQKVPVIVGFWADQNGLNFGWEDVQGVFTTILDPNATFAGNQNLLGVNDLNKAAGFWTDSANHAHGFVVHLASTHYS